MTQLQRRTLECPKCNESFSILYFASIASWMDPKRAEDFLEGKGYHFTCPSCGQNIRLVTTIIINAPKGMFTISTDALKEERIAKYREFGLLDENENFKDPQVGWLLQQLAKSNPPKDTNFQMSKQSKLLEDINAKIQLYKIYLKENRILDDLEENAFNELQKRWEKEREMEGSYLHRPKSTRTDSKPAILFFRLMEDLRALKSQLDKLK